MPIMKRRDFLARWGLSSLKISLGFLEGEFAPRDPDRAAAWELYEPAVLQTRLHDYARAPAAMAAVEDLPRLEKTSE